MLLELAENSTIQKIYVPLPSGGAALVKESFFDGINDFEFSRLTDDLRGSAHNKNIDLIGLWEGRSFRLSRPSFYVPDNSMSMKFGDWLANTGKKIETFFKPTPQKQETQTVPLIQPDGSIINQTTSTVTPAQTSGFENLITAVGSVFGLTKPQQIQVARPPDNTLKYVGLGVAGLAFGALVYKLAKGR